MKLKLSILLVFCIINFNYSQEASLDFYLKAAQQNNPSLLENNNLQKIGQYQNELIDAEHNSFQVDVTSEVLFAPYFNNNGKFIDVTTTPSPESYGYAEAVSNGGLYSAQLNVTKEIFNRSRVENLLFQNKLQNAALQLSSEEIEHHIQKVITDAYIQVYQLQLKKKLTREIIGDLENRLKVVEILVKKGILQQTDYLLLQLNIDNKKLELQQVQSNLSANFLKLNNASGIKSDEIRKLQKPEISLKAYPPGFVKDSFSFAKDSLAFQPDTFIENTDSTSYYYQRKFENDSLQIAADKQVFENKYKPKLTAYGNTGLNAVELNRISHYIGFSAGLKLSVPIYDGGQRKINELKSELKYDNLETYKENEKIKKQNTLQSLLEQMESINKGLKLINAQLEKQRNIMEIYKAKMLQGQVSIIDYLSLIQNYKTNVETRLQMQTNLWLLQNEYNATNW